VRVAAAAFGDNRPARDLWLSPGHGVCVNLIDDVFVPVGQLINGATIAQVEVPEVTYWHVELESHDVLLAEGLPAESYLDMGNRAFFGEAAVVSFDASPDVPLDAAARTRADFCRPFHAEGPLVEALRGQLRRRAETLGWTLDQSPLADLHLMVDGERIEPVTRGLTARFSVPAGASDVWLVSAASRPNHVIASPDGRELGICLGGLAIVDGFASRAIALDDSLLEVGFHAFEQGVRRWTDGHARLPAALWADTADGFFLRVELSAPAVPRWAPPGAAGHVGDTHAPSLRAVR